MASKLSQISDKLVDVSQGRLPAELILKNCNLLSTYSGEVIDNVQVAIYKDRIAFVGQDAKHTAGRGTNTIDLQGKFISPGLMDAHAHIDFLVTPTEFARQALLHGTLAIFADPVDMVSVLGNKGFNLFLQEVRTLPVRVFTVVPMAVPQDPKFSSSRYMKYEEVVRALDNDDVLGLGEVLSWVRVLDKEKELLKIMKYALSKNKIINGHTAGARGAKLDAYISSGIFSCHEPINYDEAIERLRLGMWVMLREGTVRRDLHEMISQVHSKEINHSRLMMASDGVDPEDVVKIGYMDHALRICVKSGMHPAKAAQIASLNTATYYGLDKDLGGIAPAKLADIVVFHNLQDFKISKVFVGGKLLVNNGAILLDQDSFEYPVWAKKTMNVKKKLQASDFYIKPPIELIKYGKVGVLVANLQTDIITRQESAELKIINNNVAASRELDVWKVAVIDRHWRSGKIGLGFMKGFRTDVDAFAGTINVDENELVVIGIDEEQMAIAANTIIDMNGGMAVVKDGVAIAKYQMDVAGLMSSKSFEEAEKEYEAMNNVLKKHGCPFEKPLKVLFFVTFVALPEVRFTHNGMVNVKRRAYVSIFA
ncbi:MAG: adenine deaminase [Nitrososphaerales archaeon]